MILRTEERQEVLTLPKPQKSSSAIQPQPAMAKEQVRPLAPAADRLSSDGDETAFHLKKIRQRKYIKYIGCVTAILLTLSVTIVVLFFTVFRVKEPEIKMNGVTITKLDLINNTIPRPGSNMSLTADVSVKNDNAASFKYSNTTTTLFYHDAVIGEARGPPGKAKAYRTVRMNITVDIIIDQLMSSPNITADMNSQLLTISSYSRIPGRVKMLKIISRHVVVKMRCTMALNITSKAIQDQKCKRKVSL